MTKCKFKKALNKKDPYCEHSFPSCRKEIPICAYEEKYRDLAMDARMAMCDVMAEYGDDCY